MNRKILIYICLCLAPGFTLPGQQTQDPTELFQAAVQKYLNAEEYSCNFTLRTRCEQVEGYQTPPVVSGRLVKKDSSFLLVQGKVRTLDSRGYTLHISDEDKVIIIQKSAGIDRKGALDQFLQVEKEQVNVSLLSSGRAGYTTLKLVPVSEAQSYVKQARVVLRPDGWIESVTIEYDKTKQTDFGQKCDQLEINYSNYRFQVPYSSDLDYKHYVVIAGNKVVPATAFRNYQVVSSLNIENP